MLTDQIMATVTELARKDSKAKIPIYDKRNEGAAIYARASKISIVPRPELHAGKYMRMIYTAARYFIEVAGAR